MRSSSRLKDIAEALTTLTPGAGPATTWFLPELRDLMGAAFAGAYRPVATDQGWSLEFMYGAGDHASSQIRAFERWVVGLKTSNRFLGYSPYSVEVRQRNRTLLTIVPSDLASRSFPQVESLYRAVGQPGYDQVRVLLCDGPRLLSWLGATREEPFTKRDAAVLQYLTRPVQHRFRLERQLMLTSPNALAMEAALEALGRPAFVVSPRNTIDFANRVGAALLEQEGNEVLASISESARSAPRGAFTVTRLAVPAGPTYLLAIQKERGPGIGGRVSLAQRRWALTARQTHVLELVLTGVTNKEIARQSSCAEVTVEKHVTELYRRSGSRSRADLVSRVFQLAGE